MSVAYSTEPNTSPPSSASRLWLATIRFLTRRRVAISAVLFTSLTVADVVTGVRPHDLFNVSDPVIWIGLALVVSGVALRSWAVGILRKNDVLTTTGPYDLTRNPLYVGSFLMMFGFCAIIGDVKYVWFMLAPIAFLYLLRVLTEEQDLARRFGGEWTSYRRQTPRILPRRLWPRGAAEWRLSKWLVSREYRAALGALAGLAAIQAWHFLSTRG